MRPFNSAMVISYENPVRAGIVENAEDYLYTCARAFAVISCPLEISITLLPLEKISKMRTIDKLICKAEPCF